MLEFLGAGYKRSRLSFLFSLRNKDNLAPFFANIKKDEQHNAIYCYYSYGPKFGEGSDLFISDNPQVNQSSSDLGRTYELPPGYVHRSEKARNLLAGQFHFTTTEIEVFN